MEPFVLNKIKLPLETFWNLPEDRRSAFLLLGLFLNETNWLIRLLAKADQGLPATTNQTHLAPEEEAAESLVGLLVPILAGKVFEGWERLTERKGTPNSILDRLPLSPKTIESKTVFKQKLDASKFGRIRNEV